jgi:hypothetical protein
MVGKMEGRRERNRKQDRQTKGGKGEERAKHCI